MKSLPARIIALLLIPSLLSNPVLAASQPSCSSAMNSIFLQEALQDRGVPFPPALGASGKVQASQLLPGATRRLPPVPIDAQALLDEAVTMGRNMETWSALHMLRDAGLALESAGFLKAALGCYELGVRLAVKDYDSHQRVGEFRAYTAQVRAKLGHTGRARALFNRAIGEARHQREGYNTYLLNVLEAMIHSGLSTQVQGIANHMSFDNESLGILVAAFAAHGDMAEASLLFHRMDESADDHFHHFRAAARIQLALAWIARGNVNKAIVLVDGMRWHDDALDKAIARLGAAKRFGDALRLISTLEESDEYNIHTGMYLANKVGIAAAQIEAGRRSNAQVVFNSVLAAIHADRDHAIKNASDVLAHMGAAMARSGDRAQAEQLFDQAFKLIPLNGVQKPEDEGLITLARYEADTQFFDRAIKTLTYTYRDDDDILLARADVALKMARAQDVRSGDYFTQIIEAAKKRPMSSTLVLKLAAKQRASGWQAEGTIFSVMQKMSPTSDSWDFERIMEPFLGVGLAAQLIERVDAALAPFDEKNTPAYNPKDNRARDSFWERSRRSKEAADKVFSRVATVFLESGDLENALTVIRKIHERRLRAPFLTKLVMAVAARNGITKLIVNSILEEKPEETTSPEPEPAAVTRVTLTTEPATRKGGARLQELRKATGKNQTVFGKKFRLTLQEISALERGAKPISPAFAARFAAELGVSADEFLPESAAQSTHKPATAEPRSDREGA